LLPWPLCLMCCCRFILDASTSFIMWHYNILKNPPVAACLWYMTWFWSADFGKLSRLVGFFSTAARKLSSKHVLRTLDTVNFYLFWSCSNTFQISSTKLVYYCIIVLPCSWCIASNLTRDKIKTNGESVPMRESSMYMIEGWKIHLV